MTDLPGREVLIQYFQQAFEQSHPLSDDRENEYGPVVVPKTLSQLNPIYIHRFRTVLLVDGAVYDSAELLKVFSVSDRCIHGIQHTPIFLTNGGQLSPTL